MYIGSGFLRFFLNILSTTTKLHHKFFMYGSFYLRDCGRSYGRRKIDFLSTQIKMIGVNVKIFLINKINLFLQNTLQRIHLMSHVAR